MGDFVYNGDHSITIGKFNTWKTWHMAPKSRPFVVAPQPKTEYVDVPGADGSLDYTEALTGGVRYANRTGTWEFIVDNGYNNWVELYSNILTTLHGKWFEKIILDDDPDYYWTGRLTVTGSFGNKDFSSVSISYNLEPYKSPIGTTRDKVWRWNDLFATQITYGPFSVIGQKARNFINDSDSPVICVINSSRLMKAYKYTSEGDLYDLLTNEYQDRDYIYFAPGNNTYQLLPGDNYLYFVGNGTIRVSYSRGKKL